MANLNNTSGAARAGRGMRRQLGSLWDRLSGYGRTAWGATTDFAHGLFNNPTADEAQADEVYRAMQEQSRQRAAAGMGVKDTSNSAVSPGSADFLDAFGEMGLDLVGDASQQGLDGLFANLKGRGAGTNGAAPNSPFGYAPRAAKAGAAAASGGPTNVKAGFAAPFAGGNTTADALKAATGDTPFLGWTKGKGLSVAGKNLGGWATGINGAIQGAQAIGNITDLAKANQSTEDILNEIQLASMNNPYYQYDLTDEELKLLRNIKRGNADTSAGLGDVNWLGALGDTAMGVLTGLPGGIPGMIVGGVGGLGNSILGDMSDAQGANNAELEQLLASLEASKRNYKQMRGQRAYSQFM